MFNSSQGINIEKIKNISAQIKSGAQYENPIIELKRQFWDLSNDEGKNEFAKDLTLMANSQYGAGNIIVGIDGNTRDLHHTALPLDAADLANIINRKVLEPFTIEFNEIQVDEKIIIVVHIPRSYNKPHMLLTYKNREMFIPIRKGTRTQAADKYDLDSMYTEREKIVIPPYRLETLIGTDELVVSTYLSNNNIAWGCLINVLNTGSRINMVTGGSLTIYIEDREIEILDLNSYLVPNIEGKWQDMRINNFLKVPQNDATFVNLGFHFKNRSHHKTIQKDINLYSVRITLKDVTGNISSTNVIKLKELGS
ncbi:ATP-binding protein [Lysinibacillus fusiformis]|uniref:AlbA family DNA-binding domain-containing protein n=1 Tax=Lysinibacillus fusiformis TaxID=28031 RepID=UPI0019670AE1|nr:ATP-binding protein [Lysinibacillus fusiformis]QSB09093.1 ATP-binding protein [Lysinibacillus fusiformis]